jgi:hypothetical protein
MRAARQQRNSAAIRVARVDPAPVWREFLNSAKGADARRQTTQELRRYSGGALGPGARFGRVPQ